MEIGVSEAEHPTVGCDQRIASTVGVAAIPTTGLLSRTPPVEPKNPALNANNPPSEATTPSHPRSQGPRLFPRSGD